MVRHCRSPSNPFFVSRSSRRATSASDPPLVNGATALTRDNALDSLQRRRRSVALLECGSDSRKAVDDSFGHVADKPTQVERPHTAVAGQCIPMGRSDLAGVRLTTYAHRQPAVESRYRSRADQVVEGRELNRAAGVEQREILGMAVGVARKPVEGNRLAKKRCAAPSRARKGASASGNEHEIANPSRIHRREYSKPSRPASSRCSRPTDCALEPVRRYQYQTSRASMLVTPHRGTWFPRCWMYLRTSAAVASSAAVR